MKFIVVSLIFHSHNWWTVGPLIIISVPETPNDPTHVHDYSISWFNFFLKRGKKPAKIGKYLHTSVVFISYHFCQFSWLKITRNKSKMMLYKDIGLTWKKGCLYKDIGLTWQKWCLYKNIGLTWQKGCLYKDIGLTLQKWCLHKDIGLTWQKGCLYKDIGLTLQKWCLHKDIGLTWQKWCLYKDIGLTWQKWCLYKDIGLTCQKSKQEFANVDHKHLDDPLPFNIMEHKYTIMPNYNAHHMYGLVLLIRNKASLWYPWTRRKT